MTDVVLTQTAPRTDIQFNPSDKLEQTQAKLRRLVQDLQKTEAAVNAAVAEINILAAESGGGGVAKHVLATTSGLGPDHTTSGLTEGQVLKAIASDNAAFVQLRLEDLAQMDIVNIQEGDALVFISGYWTPTPISAVVSVSGNNLGSGIGVYKSTIDNVLQFKSLKQGTGITLVDDGETIVINGSAIPGGGGGYPPELGYAGII